MDEVSWVHVAVALCVGCAVICTAVAVFVWRQHATVAELRRAIGDGDQAVMKDVQEAVEELRGDFGAVRAIVVRVEAHQATEQKHALTARDLGPLHDKINRVAEQQAETRGELTEVARMLREQLRILQNARQQ